MSGSVYGLAMEDFLADSLSVGMENLAQMSTSEIHSKTIDVSELIGGEDSGLQGYFHEGSIVFP